MEKSSLNPEQAEELGRLLIARAAAARLGQSEPFHDNGIFTVAILLRKCLLAEADIQSIGITKRPQPHAYRNPATGQLIRLPDPGQLTEIVFHEK